jgi:hypothetical protein
MFTNRKTGNFASTRLARAAGAGAVALLLAIAGCANVAPPGDAAAADERDYRDFVAAIDATGAGVEPNGDLVAIARADTRVTWREDGRILAVTLQNETTARTYFSPPGKTLTTSPEEKYSTWITTAPQVKRFCQSLGLSGRQLSRRLKQYLGLDPTRSYDRFIEIWVDPRDVFRPCADPEADDHQCRLAWTSNPVVPRVPDYRQFYVNLYQRSYAAGGAPWTRLGYTYDWSPAANRVGASEFVLAPGSSYEIRASYTTDEYCRP